VAGAEVEVAVGLLVAVRGVSLVVVVGVLLRLVVGHGSRHVDGLRLVGVRWLVFVHGLLLVVRDGLVDWLGLVHRLRLIHGLRLVHGLGLVIGGLGMVGLVVRLRRLVLDFGLIGRGLTVRVIDGVSDGCVDRALLVHGSVEGSAAVEAQIVGLALGQDGGGQEEEGEGQLREDKGKDRRERARGNSIFLTMTDVVAIRRVSLKWTGGPTTTTAFYSAHPKSSPSSTTSEGLLALTRGRANLSYPTLRLLVQDIQR